MASCGSGEEGLARYAVSGMVRSFLGVVVDVEGMGRLVAVEVMYMCWYCIHRADKRNKKSLHT
jgi:hypothetical protein